MTKRIITLLVALSAVLLVGCGERKSKSFTKSVKVQYPVSLTNSTTRSFSGVVKEYQKVNLGFKVAGQIQNIYVREGDYVKEGSLIAQLDDSDYKLQLSATEIQYQQLSTEVNRLKELYKRKSLPANDYEKAASGLQQLEVQRKAYRNQVANTTLRAPFSGYIQSVKYRKAEMLDAGMAVVSLVDDGNAVVEVDIPTALFLNRDKLQMFFCKNSANPNKDYSLKMRSILPQSNNNQLYKMYLDVSPTDSKELLSGMNVEVFINVEEDLPTENTFVLPPCAVFNKNDKSYVWIVSDDRVHRQEIVINGLDEKGCIIVVSGISENDNVVVAGIRAIHENDSVRILQPATSTNKGGLL